MVISGIKMINRIRDIRKQKGMTLADVAARCTPPTTAQTIGRLETGMRNLSLVWMNRIAAALEVEPEVLVRGEEAEVPRFVARLTESGAAVIGTGPGLIGSDIGLRTTFADIGETVAEHLGLAPGRHGTSFHAMIGGHA